MGGLRGRKFLLGFHNRKKERKIEYLTKKALKAKQERVLEKIAVVSLWGSDGVEEAKPPQA